MIAVRFSISITFAVVTIILLSSSRFGGGARYTAAWALDSSPRRDGGGNDDNSAFTLIKLMIINRHGHRAPNGAFWRMCPNDLPNRRRFGVHPEGLTGVGLAEETAFGRYLRETYNDFISPSYNDRKHFVSAVGEPRTLQSAQSIAQALWRDGYGPRKFLPRRPQVVPVFSDIASHEYLLNDAPCWPRTKADATAWVRTVGAALAKDPANQKLITDLEALCGMSPAMAATRSLDMLIKTVIDGVIFTHDFGLTPLNGKIDKKTFFALRNLSNTFLLGKLYGTDAQKTYVAGNLPELMVETGRWLEGNGTYRLPSDFSATNEGDAVPRPVNIFCVHREMMYGLAFFWDWEYSVPDMGPGELPAASTVILEYVRERATGRVWVRPKLWTPRPNTGGPLSLPGCAKKTLCAVEELQSIYLERVRRTGTWQTLCSWRGSIQFN